jgi:iron(III) transport system substrate-binding protein
MLRRSLLLLAPALALTLPGSPANAQERVLNLYSSRHYDTDRALYDGFTQRTGIRIRLIEGEADQLIERIRNEGANSPADVLITVDAARLHRAQAANLLQPIRSAVLEARIPAYLRDPEGHWFGLSKRARVIMFDRQNPPQNLTRYEDLADPRFRGQICTRSSSHPYTLSLMGSIMAANGEQAAEAWARGVVANFARPPQGGDVPQIQAIPTGQCRLAIANTYYLARFGASQNPAERALYDRIGVIFPNQADRGTHVNISGAGVVRTAPNREAAVAFLEYLTSDDAQRMFANGNFEYPVVAGIEPHPALARFGEFREDNLNAARYGAASAQALQIMQRAGWR